MSPDYLSPDNVLVVSFGEDPATKACSECKSDIPEAARKCKYCASLQTAA